MADNGPDRRVRKEDAAVRKGNEIMMVIKVNYYNGDSTTTKINGTIEEIARYYFSRQEVKNIEILEGGEDVNEFRTVQPLEIYREDPEAIKEFELIYNIVLRYKTTFVEPLPSGVDEITASHGLITV